MSTRSSIFYAHGIHLYEEVMSEDICMEIDDFVGEELKPGNIKLNEKYESLTMPKDAWIDFAQSILRKLAVDKDSIKP